MRTLKISVSRTVQVDRFEPVTVTVEEQIQIKNESETKAARLELYTDVTQQVTKYIKNEIKKYRLEKKQED